MRDEPPGWYSRGYLPHFDDGRKLQAVTYRLVDALPAEVVAKLGEQALGDEQRRAEIERYLDNGHGSCILRDAANAEIVVNAWQHFHQTRYHLHAWCVMPNHVHVLIAPLANHTLGEIVQSQKSYTAKAILRRFPERMGRLKATSSVAGGTPALPERHIWQPDYYDRFIRNERHYTATADYIHENPVKAGLARTAAEWPWSSARGWERGRPAH